MRRIVLAFPGQGSQYVDMGKILMSRSSRAREIFQRANEVLKLDLSEIAKDEKTLTRTENAQPAILTHSIAAMEAFREEHDDEFHVDTCVGHSLGEFTALVASGCLSLEDGVRLVRGRGEAMASASNESQKMMALMPTKYNEELKSIIYDVNSEDGGVCDIANVNSKNQVVLSGNSSTVDKATDIAMSLRLARRSFELNTSAAFHSRLMKPARQHLEELLENINISKPCATLISNVTGEEIVEVDMIKTLLLRQLTSTVNWLGCMNTLSKRELPVIELGPGNVLSTLMKRHGIPDVSSYSGDCSS